MKTYDNISQIYYPLNIIIKNIFIIIINIQMKFQESHFEEYISAVNKINLHPKLEKYYSHFPDTISKLGNILFYGPSGVGKYSQMLYSIKKYSHSDLKYEKKLSIIFNKDVYFFKISDIHYEIDMSLLGCNSKLLWHDIYQQIVDIISAKSEKSGIIVCKEFQNIHSELLENFYSYMQDNNISNINIKYILLTEEISFIPDNILNCCEVINVSRPSKIGYSKIIKNKLPVDMKVESITNIKNLHVNINELMYPHKIICDKIIKEMISVNNLKFLKFRDYLYDIFIYNLNITECIWFITTSLFFQKHIDKKNISIIMLRTYNFLKYYNNNYRPIYHLESYLFYLTSIIHGYSTSV
jgi:hypothetical protein